MILHYIGQKMNNLLVLAFLFYVGSLIGWILEFLFRNLISHDGPKTAFFINPGFCQGPYLPIYGIGTIVMFIISYVFKEVLHYSQIIPIILIIGLFMTLIELIGGYLLLKYMNLRLWDYRQFKGNFKGYICPQFTLIWTILGAIFYLLVYPYCINGIIWLSKNLAFSFFIGLFYGIFIIDLINSSKILVKIKEFGDEHNIIVVYEDLKQSIQELKHSTQQKIKFFNQIFIDKLSLLKIIGEDKRTYEEKRKGHQK